MKRLRVAVIGAGHLGRIHAKLVSSIESVQLVAVADPNTAAQETILKQHDVPVVDDYSTLIGEIDAAIIATPTRFHFDVASHLLQNGIHTLIEKPMTDSASDAQRLVEIASESGCIVQVGHCERFNAAIQRAKQEIGTPKYVIAARMSGYTFRSTDIGVVNDLMIHDIDLVNSLFPGDVTDVRASGFSVFGRNEDMAQARVQFDCGGVANLTATRCSFKPERSFQIFGTKGYASVDLATQTIDVVTVPDWIRSRSQDVISMDSEVQSFIRENLFDTVLPKTTLTIDPVNAILEEQKDWIHCIQDGGKPVIDVLQGAEAVQIAAKVIEQINQHSWIDSKSGPLSQPISETGVESPEFILKPSKAA